MCSQALPPHRCAVAADPDAAAGRGGGLTDPGGGMVPGPVMLQASAPGAVSSSGLASGGGKSGVAGKRGVCGREAPDAGAGASTIVA